MIQFYTFPINSHKFPNNACKFLVSFKLGIFPKFPMQTKFPWKHRTFSALAALVTTTLIRKQVKSILMFYRKKKVKVNDDGII